MVSAAEPSPADSERIDELIRACRAAAEPSHDLVIAGEGNASLTTSEGRLYVTASGCRLAELAVQDVVAVDRDHLLAGLDNVVDDAGWLEVVRASTRSNRRPTVEVGMHAVISACTGPGAVLHTHPTPVLAMMAQGRGHELATTRLLPDHVVMCGPTSSHLPYIDPGHELARHLAGMTGADRPPPLLYLDNHGIVVNAPSGAAALDITLMATKAARILVSTTPGDVQALPSSVITRIAEREDEKVRQNILGLLRNTSPA